MATTFRRALKEAYDLVAGLPTLYLDVAPPKTDYPRCVLTIDGGGPVRPLDYNDQNVPTLSEGYASFTFFYENSGVDAEVAAMALMQTLTPESLVLSTSTYTTLFRVSEPEMGQADERSPSGNLVYFARVSYRGMFGTEY